MSPRFLFLNDAGQEVRATSLDELARHRETGALDEDTLLYDAITREWAPARSHPVYRLIMDEEAGAEDPAPVAPILEDDGMVSLQPVPEDAVEMDEIRLFLEARERERQEERRERDAEIRTTSFLKEDEGRGPGPLVVGGFGDAPPEPGDPGYREWASSSAPQPPGGAQPSPAPATPPAGAGGGGRGGVFAPSRRRRPPSNPRPGWFRNGPWVRWFRRQQARTNPVRQGVLILMLLVVGAWGIADAWQVPSLAAAGGDESLVVAAAVTPPSPLMPALVEAESAAFRDMVQGMERLRERLRVDEPPPSWIGGPYLANAVGFPEVRQFWIRYLEFVDTLRLQEEDLFRSGFVGRLQMEGIRGPVVSIRLARALRDFEGDAPRRQETYGAMEELGLAALELHDFLVANASSIRYAPVDRGFTDDPVLEAVPVDAATEEGLWTNLDRVLAAIDAVAGPDPLRRRDVSRQVLGGLARDQDVAALPR